MAKVPGYKIVIQIEDKTLVGYRSHDMEIARDMAEATTGESTGQAKEYEPMYYDGKFSVGGLYDPATGSGVSTINEVLALLVAGTQVTCIWGNTEAGSVTQTAEGFITNVKISGPYDDLSSYTLDIQTTGAIAPGTVSA